MVPFMLKKNDLAKLHENMQRQKTICMIMIKKKAKNEMNLFPIK